MIAQKWYSDEVVARLRRMLGVKSPMNVWKKQFTDFSMWDFKLDLPINAWEKQFAIGSTVTIRKPKRYSGEA